MIAWNATRGELNGARADSIWIIFALKIVSDLQAQVKVEGPKAFSLTIGDDWFTLTLAV
jgi:hypothetical protein